MNHFAKLNNKAKSLVMYSTIKFDIRYLGAVKVTTEVLSSCSSELKLLINNYDERSFVSFKNKPQ